LVAGLRKLLDPRRRRRARAAAAPPPTPAEPAEPPEPPAVKLDAARERLRREIAPPSDEDN
jgi:hypothetical protein